MKKSHFELVFESGEDSLDVRTFLIHEALSTPYLAVVEARSPKHDVDLESLVGKGVMLILRTHNPGLTMPERTWKGLCSRAALVRTDDDTYEGSLATYEIQIVPRLWLCSHNREHRVFQRKKIPDLVKELLAAWGIEPKLDLKEAYPELDYLVQYGESDFAFISRLLERAGITYFFDGKADGKLMLADQPHKNPPRGPIRYNDDPADKSSGEHVNLARLVTRVASGAAVLRDYDFRRPDFDVEGEAEKAQGPEAKYELYDYLPGAAEIIDPQAGGNTPVADDKAKVRAKKDEAKKRAQRRLDAERCRRRAVELEANVLDLWPGVVFSLTDHPRDDMGEPLLMTEYTMEGTASDKWTMHGRSVYTDVPFRPMEDTDHPELPGVQSAAVVGPEGEEIHCDEFGRVRVQFHWDREGKLDDNSSCWMRVNQGWAGKGYGRVLLPRIGQEVSVSFYDGDPERPIISGRLYNAVNRVPAENELPRYKTRTSWLSDTTPHEDNSFNVIRFEDAKDEEYVYMQAQRDQQKLVKRNETERTGQNRNLLVGGNRHVAVKEVDAVLVGKKYSLQMMHTPEPDHLKIKELGKPEVGPIATKVEMVDRKVLCTVGESTMVMDGPEITFEAKSRISFKAGGTIKFKGGPNIHINPVAPGPPQAACLETGSQSGAPFVQKAK